MNNTQHNDFRYWVPECWVSRFFILILSVVILNVVAPLLRGNSLACSIGQCLHNTQNNDIQHKNAKDNNKKAKPSITTLSITISSVMLSVVYAMCHTFCTFMLSVVMNVVILNVVAPGQWRRKEVCWQWHLEGYHRVSRRRRVELPPPGGQELKRRKKKQKYKTCFKTGF